MHEHACFYASKAYQPSNPKFGAWHVPGTEFRIVDTLRPGQGLFQLAVAFDLVLESGSEGRCIAVARKHAFLAELPAYAWVQQGAP
jgi:hypothetical protein